jgi:hypothetical protein
MHAVLVTFESTVGLDDLAAPFAAYAEALRGVPGLAAKVWLHDGATVGGFHLFADRADADAYLQGDLFAGVAANPAFRAFRVEHFGVLDGLGAVTGGRLLDAVPA